MITHYLVYSDNWHQAVMTKACYEQIRLEMSSGDFGSHLAIPLTADHAERLADRLDQEYIYHTTED